ncbi:AraC family transcriptional regulator (plasmid) [Rhizobium leguminosarum]|uniref:AraC family transcriptional regulator n=1 Tax=Rhizobium leguminosarum TaxID=384 RepID=A0A1L3ZPW1_RHILE|nr:helix-turn-helix transcriptional regulator [Rhizobium leguminosarum]API57693.1 AraC family transcriptional regulator [Rhizobium leguminosarum]
MPENALSDFLPRYHGSSFEPMVETFTGIFGPLDASPAGSARDFHWKSDFWSDGTSLLVTSQFSSEWSASPRPEMPQYLSIIVPRTGAVNVALGREIFEGTPGRLLLSNNHEIERFFLRGEIHRSDVLRLSWTMIVQKLAAILDTPLVGALELSPVVDLSTPSGLLIGSLAQTIIVGMRNGGPLLHSPIAMSNLTQAFADLMLRSIPHRFSHLLDKKICLIAPWHVRRAIEFMQANIDRPFTMQMVADEVGVSIRALEIGFRSFRATTPAAYLRTMRLRAAREDLLDPSNRQSVRDICLKWGFFHFGRFSAVYKAAYGESPTETRKRITAT